MIPRRLQVIIPTALASACSVQPPPPASELASVSAPLPAPGYVDARSYFTQPEAIDAWYELTFRLRDEFDAICGDTFCEGDFSNYESLGFRCSVESSEGTIGQCVWIFAASTDEVLPETGEIAVETAAWRCRMPIADDTPATDFLTALTTSEEGALYAPLPGTDRVLYDGLIDCL